MAASRLSDSQKQELVERYRTGETAQALAQMYGCSPNTVSRVLKAAMDPDELAALKTRKPSRQRAALAADAAPDPADELPAVAAAADPPPVVGAGALAAASAVLTPEPTAASHPLPPVGDPGDDPAAAEAGPSVLAIDDADDFADSDADDGETDEEDAAEAEEVLAALAAASGGSSEGVVSARPLHSGALPTSVYLLVDKTVELEARPLSEFPELGSLPEEERQRQALMLYANPRQAKRQCGRSQRVIKVPDSGVLQRTSRYLLAQGITRLVLEGGAVFAIPGS